MKNLLARIGALGFLVLGLPSMVVFATEPASKFLPLSSACVVGDSLPPHFGGHDPTALVDLLSKAKTAKDKYESQGEYEGRMHSLLAALSPRPATTLCLRDLYGTAIYKAESHTLSVALNSADHSGFRDIGGSRRKFAVVELKATNLDFHIVNAPIEGGTMTVTEDTGDVIRLGLPFDDYFASIGRQPNVVRTAGHPVFSIADSLDLKIKMSGNEARDVNEPPSPLAQKRLVVMHVVQLDAPFVSKTKDHMAPRTVKSLPRIWNFNESLIIAKDSEIVVFDDETGHIFSRLSGTH